VLSACFALAVLIINKIIRLIHMVALENRENIVNTRLPQALAGSAESVPTSS
jgi:hypothetical protein